MGKPTDELRTYRETRVAISACRVSSIYLALGTEAWVTQTRAEDVAGTL